MDRASFRAPGPGSRGGGDSDRHRPPPESMDRRPSASNRPDMEHAPYADRQRYHPGYHREPGSSHPRDYQAVSAPYPYDPYSHPSSSHHHHQQLPPARMPTYGHPHSHHHQAPAGLVSPSFKSHSRQTPSPPRYVPRHPPAPAYEHYPYSSQLPPHMAMDRGLARGVPGLEVAPSQPPIKRPRVSLACLACRNRKSRCDGNRPTCKTCAHMKIECKWPEIDFRRAKASDPSRLQRKSQSGLSGSEAQQEHSSSVSERADTSFPSALSISSLNNPASERANGKRSPQYDEPAAGSPGEHRPSARGEADPSARSPRGRHEDAPASLKRERADSVSATSTFDYSDTKARSAGPEAQRQGYQQALSASPRMSAHRPRSPLPAAVIRFRDYAAKMLAARTNDLNKFRHGALSSQKVLAKMGQATNTAKKNEAERLDEVYAADWSSLGISRSSLSRDFSDAMAGITAFIEPLDSEPIPDDTGAIPAHLHLFRVRRGSISSGLDLERVTLKANLPAEPAKYFFDSARSKDGAGPPALLSGVGFDINECLELSHSEEAAERSREESRAGTLTSSSLKSSKSEQDIQGLAASSEQLFDGDLPRTEVLEDLLDTFFIHLRKEFPFVVQPVIEMQLKTGTLHPALVNVMCGLSIRFSKKSWTRSKANVSGEPFYIKAKSLFGAAMAQPSKDAVSAGILLSAAELSLGKVSSSLAFTAASSRMAMELGLHRLSTLDSNSSERERSMDLLLFWSVYCMDRITSLHCGTPLLLKDSDIELPPLPTPGGNATTIWNFFADHIRFVGRMVEALNAPLDARLGGILDPGRIAQLDDLVDGQVHRYENFPEEMRFTEENFQRLSSTNDVLMFCGVHLAHHGLIMLVHLLARSIPLDSFGLRRLRHSARVTSDIARLVLESGNDAVVNSTMLTPTLVVAGCIFISESEYLDETTEERQNARTNVDYCLRLLEKRAAYWPDAGIGASILKEGLELQGQGLSKDAVDQLISQVRTLRALPPTTASIRKDGDRNDASFYVHNVTDARDLAPFFPNL